MNKAQKIILLVAATWIIFLIVFPPDPGDFLDIDNDPIPAEVFLIALFAGVAFLIAKKKPPVDKE